MARDFTELCERRAARALVLAERYPESSEPLRFLSAVASFQRDPAPRALLALVIANGPELLRRVADDLDERGCGDAVEAYASGADRTSAKSFFGRVMLQARMGAGEDGLASGQRAPSGCPRCGYPAQVGRLVREGDGTALRLHCSICFDAWPFARERCLVCTTSDPEALVYYEAPELEHLQVRACDTCHVYVNLLRSERAADAVPDIDEIVGLPLDVWAGGKGYRKVVPNLIGM